MQLWLIPALPLAGFLINGIFGRRFSKAVVNAIGIGSVLLAFAWAVKTVLALGDSPIFEHDFDWNASFEVVSADDHRRAGTHRNSGIPEMHLHLGAVINDRVRAGICSSASGSIRRAPPMPAIRHLS